ncbi:hypothetical protein C0991_000995 [Blastosporella zonata]|nr:hypothetical protein C0991_000995 [Blastosporella zonata]
MPDPMADDEPTDAALDAHFTAAQYILTQKDRPIPTLEQMREAVNQVVTDDTIKKRIADLKAQHIQDLQRMYNWHAHEYRADARDMFLARDDVMYPPKDEDDKSIQQSNKDIMDFYERARYYVPQQMRWENELEELRHSHLEMLLPLYQELKDIEDRREQERKRREADFPQSIADYKTKPAEAQLRVATFLMADAARQERMLTEFNWASRQVKPLLEIFKKDDKFKSEIIVLKMRR